MLMSNGCHLYVLLGFMPLIFGTEAFNLGDFDFWQDDAPQPEDPHGNDYYPPQQAFYHESPPVPVYPEPVYHESPLVQVYPEPVYEPAITPVKIATVLVQQEIELDLHVAEKVPLNIRKIKYLTTTEIVTLTLTSKYRSTVVVTPTQYKTDTMVVETTTHVTGNVISHRYTTVTETKLSVQSVWKTQTLYKKIHTPVVMSLTVEAQKTDTVLQAYTLTTTNRKIITVTTTVTADIWKKNSVQVDVVEVETETETIPYYKTNTAWITQTHTTTICKEW